MYRCWKSIPKQERQEAFDFYVSLPKCETNMRITDMMINKWKKNWSNTCCPWGMLLSIRYGVKPTIVLPSTVWFHFDIPVADVMRFMQKHDMTHNLTNAALARMMGVQYVP